MAITVGTRYFNTDAGGTAQDFTSIAIQENAKVIAFLAWESTTVTIASGPTFNGMAMTHVATQTFNSSVQMAVYYLDTSLAAGSYTLSWTASGGVASACTVYNLTGAAAGAPEATTFDTEGSSAAVVGDGTSITCSEGAYLMACAINSATSATVTVGGDVTGGDDNTTIGARITNAADAQTSGSKTATFTYSTNSTNKLMMAVSVAEAASSGLSISTVTPSSSNTASKIIGTGLSAGQTLTYKGVACTSVSASSSTTLSCVFPDFFSNNIKLGAVHEFKVVD